MKPPLRDMYDILTPLKAARDHLKNPGQWVREHGIPNAALEGEPCNAYGALIWATQGSAALPHALWALNMHLKGGYGMIHYMEADPTQSLENILLAFDVAIAYEESYAIKKHGGE